jgi:hypothetical protein
MNHRLPLLPILAVVIAGESLYSFILFLHRLQYYSILNFFLFCFVLLLFPNAEQIFIFSINISISIYNKLNICNNIKLLVCWLGLDAGNRCVKYPSVTSDCARTSWPWPRCSIALSFQSRWQHTLLSQMV